MNLNSDDNFGLDYLNGYSELQNFWEEQEVHDFLSQAADTTSPLLDLRSVKEEEDVNFWSDILTIPTGTEPELSSVQTDPIDEHSIFYLPLLYPSTEVCNPPTAIRPDLLAGPSNEVSVQRPEAPSAQVEPASKLEETKSEHIFVPWTQKPPKKTRSKGQKNSTSIACYFCRRRKIRCGGPQPKHDGACKSCVYFKRECVFPTESFRGRRPSLKSTKAA